MSTTIMSVILKNPFGLNHILNIGHSWLGINHATEPLSSACC